MFACFPKFAQVSSSFFKYSHVFRRSLKSFHVLISVTSLHTSYLLTSFFKFLQFITLPYNVTCCLTMLLLQMFTSFLKFLKFIKSFLNFAQVLRVFICSNNFTIFQSFLQFISIVLEFSRVF